ASMWPSGFASPAGAPPASEEPPEPPSRGAQAPIPATMPAAPAKAAVPRRKPRRPRRPEGLVITVDASLLWVSPGPVAPGVERSPSSRVDGTLAALRRSDV